MPAAHLQLLGHLQLVLLKRHLWLVHCHKFLAFIRFVLSHVFASFIEELHVKLAVGLVLHVDYVHVAIVSASEEHRRIWADL